MFGGHFCHRASREKYPLGLLSSNQRFTRILLCVLYLHDKDDQDSLFFSRRFSILPGTHYDNLSNREDVARLMGILCEAFETGKENVVTDLKRLKDSRKKGGDFCREVTADNCMTEGYTFSKRYCSNDILGVTGRATWKFTCTWKTKPYQCDRMKNRLGSYYLRRRR